MDMTPSIIRDVVSADIEALCGLLAQLFKLEQDFTPDREKQRRALKRLLQSPQAHLWVAEVDGVVVGMVSLQQIISTAEGGPAGWVEDLVVEHGYRGRA